MNIEVLYFEGCPNHLPVIEMVRETRRGRVLLKRSD